MVKVKKFPVKKITQADIDKLAFEIDSIGKGRITRNGKPVQTVAPPTDHSEEYKKHKQYVDDMLRLKNENAIRKFK